MITSSNLRLKPGNESSMMLKSTAVRKHRRNLQDSDGNQSCFPIVELGLEELFSQAAVKHECANTDGFMGELAGIDNLLCSDFRATDLLSVCSQILLRIHNGTYVPNDLREVEVTSEDGRSRKLLLPTIAERLVYEAGARVLQDSLVRTGRFSRLFFESSSTNVQEIFSEFSSLVANTETESTPVCVVEANIVSPFENIRIDAIHEALRAHGLPEESIDCLCRLTQIGEGSKWSGKVGLPEGNPLSQVLLTATLQHHLFMNFNWKKARLIAPFAYVNNLVIFSNNDGGLRATLDKISQLLEPTGLRLQSDFQIENLRESDEVEVLGFQVFASFGLLEISPGESCYKEIQTNLMNSILHPNPHEAQKRYMDEFVKSTGHIYLTLGENGCDCLLATFLMDSELRDLSEVNDLGDHFLHNWWEAAIKLEQKLPFKRGRNFSEKSPITDGADD
jgi:hypothetical protein